MQFLRLVLLGLVIAGLVSCASVSNNGPGSEGYSVGESVIPGTVIKPPDETSPPVRLLLAQARQASQDGQLSSAESYLERALRIEPRNAVLWNYIAKTYLYQARYSQAAGMASKSNSLAPADKVLQADNWRIIAQARAQSGDSAGARLAERRAAEYSSP